MEIKSEALADCPALWPRLSRMQTTRGFDENLEWLGFLARAGSELVTAWDGRELVGCMVVIPCERLGPARGHCAAVGVDPATAILRSHIFVPPEYARRGVSRMLRERSTETALARGRSTRLVYGYETREILSWALKQPGTVDTGRTDDKGDPVLMAPLS